MTYKVAFIIVPLVIASIADVPDFSDSSSPMGKPLFSIIPDSSLQAPSHYSRSSSNYVAGEDYFFCYKHGPFDTTNVNNFDVTFTYELYSIENQTIMERLRLINSANKVVAGATKDTYSFQKGVRRNVTFEVPYKDYWSNNGLTLKFELLNSGKNVIKEYSAAFYPPSHSVISGESLKRNVYTSRSLGFYGDGTTLREDPEVFDFTNFGDYLNVDYYYRLDLSKNIFLFPNNHSFVMGSAFLRFNDDERLFPYLTHETNGDILIPLTHEENNSEIHFKYLRTFYINKRTLQISDQYHDGFYYTKDFYLPVNGKNIFNGKQLYFEINSAGYDRISTSIPVRYDVNKSLVGVCTDGDYCIIGGRR